MLHAASDQLSVGQLVHVDMLKSMFSGIDRIINDAATKAISAETGSRNILLRYKQTNPSSRKGS